MQQQCIGRSRKAGLFGFATTAFVLALASTAFACVTFMGQMTVDGHDGDTTVVGTGNSHAYCRQPSTAAAGHLNDTISLNVASATCNSTAHKLPAGTYEVRYNNRTSYAYDGTSWTMIPNSGCFLGANAPTTTKIGDFTVDASGNGAWSGTLGTLALPLYSVPGEASNLCIGDPEGPTVSGGKPGLLAPYQLLAI